MYATCGLASLTFFNTFAPSIPSQPGGLVWGKFFLGALALCHPDSAVSGQGK